MLKKQRRKTKEREKGKAERLAERQESCKWCAMKPHQRKRVKERRGGSGYPPRGESGKADSLTPRLNARYARDHAYARERGVHRERGEGLKEPKEQSTLLSLRSGICRLDATRWSARRRRFPRASRRHDDQMGKRKRRARAEIRTRMRGYSITSSNETDASTSDMPISASSVDAHLPLSFAIIN